MTRKFAGKELLVATHNSGKASEFQKILGPHITVKSASDFNLPDVEETGTTYHENARLKALHGAQFSNLPTLGDDSGFEVDALDGKPGLYTARFIKAQGSADQAFASLQTELGDKSRVARFVCCLCLAWPDGHVEHVKEEVVGHFTHPPRGDKGFGYDPVFMPQGYDVTFGELSHEVKNKISHRGRAVQAILKKCFL